MTQALYIHIPFCDNICSYCDFSKVLTKSSHPDQYLNRLIQEIQSYRIPDRTLKTIYIGGGTPSSLSTDQLKKLLSYLDSHFFPVKEFTIEANPESLTEEKIQVLEKYHVNRVSLGVQTFSENLLKKLNRKHSIQDVENCVSLLRKHHITNINLDFIYGIPGALKDEPAKDIQLVKELDPTHVSFYSLQIEEGTFFFIKNLRPVDDSQMRTEYDFLRKELENIGYQRYEVSNFAKPGYASEHNMTYWADQHYYGCGVSASGYLENYRYTNTKSITKYLQGETIMSKETLTRQEEEFEYLMLNLRMTEGFSISDFNKRFQKDFLTSYHQEIQKCGKSLVIHENRVRIRKDDIYIMDSILLNLLKDFS